MSHRHKHCCCEYEYYRKCNSGCSCGCCNNCCNDCCNCNNRCGSNNSGYGCGYGCNGYIWPLVIAAFFCNRW